MHKINEQSQNRHYHVKKSTEIFFNRVKRVMSQQRYSEESGFMNIFFFANTAFATLLDSNNPGIYK